MFGKALSLFAKTQGMMLEYCCQNRTNTDKTGEEGTMGEEEEGKTKTKVWD